METNSATLTILSHMYLLSLYMQIINTCELVWSTVKLLLQQWSNDLLLP